ncbi:calpain-A-like isoform X2 [Diachasmimorpha longicaudata]|uniref:calpain-A-like isoform X2 n=1 Tax=Diachasmimorpha longicaudata TaxID=58733 RepID=UPI0030B8B934
MENQTYSYSITTRYKNYMERGVAELKMSQMNKIIRGNVNNSSVESHKTSLLIPPKPELNKISGVNKPIVHRHFIYNDSPIKTRGNSIGKACFNLGGKRSRCRAKEKDQDFHKLRQQCLQSGQLFEDPVFPAKNSSLYSSRRPAASIEWKRPMEIVDNPRLFVEGFSRFDVQQGDLNDCWLLAAVANLTMYPHLFFQVVPKDQGFDKNYAGIFHFRFWQYGKWVDVVIDDRLPTCHGKLMYLSSAKNNEFWSALLEKAYAKLRGSYKALTNGRMCEAMGDFTGGVTEICQMEETLPNLFSILLKAYERNSMMGCSLSTNRNVLKTATQKGLIRHHAYSITRVKYVDIQTPNQSGRIPLLRLRNPWGNEAEWNGPWSDGSPEWRSIPDHEKAKLGLTFDSDGEFWMSFQDWKRFFNFVEICHLNPGSLSEDDLNSGKKRWEMSVFEGEWVRGVTAGGCSEFLDTFCNNPQYIVTLEYPDEGDDKCTVIVALMQKNRKAQKRMGADCLTIGFEIYPLEDRERLPKPLDVNFFKYNTSVARSPSFINLREVSCRFKLPPGTYCIVPSTYDPNEEGEFLMRVFSENKNSMHEHDECVDFGEVDDRVRDQPEPDHNEIISEFFRKFKEDDMEVDWMELKEILDYALREELQNEGFSKDICRAMVYMMDRDDIGRLGYDEFLTLWTDIMHWRAVFKLYDQTGCGYISGFQLRQALKSAGYRLNNRMLNIFGHRYGTKDGLIYFEGYIMCALRLKTMMVRGSYLFE